MPAYGRDWTKPSASSVRSASRTGTRETPYRAAIASSVSRWPGRWTPRITSSRIARQSACGESFRPPAPSALGAPSRSAPWCSIAHLD